MIAEPFCDVIIRLSFYNCKLNKSLRYCPQRFPNVYDHLVVFCKRLFSNCIIECRYAFMIGSSKMEVSWAWCLAISSRGSCLISATVGDVAPLFAKQIRVPPLCRLLAAIRE